MIITEAAYKRIGQVLADDDTPEGATLRVYVEGGGCSGFQYGFKIEEDEIDGDVVYTEDGTTIVVDPMSMMYLEGATLDFTVGLEGEMFTFKNPNAQTTCGCGSSFST